MKQDIMTSKKSVLIISLVLALFIGGLIYFVLVLKERLGSSAPKEETITERQLRELDELRQEANSKPLTQEEIQKQLEELNKLRQSQ